MEKSDCLNCFLAKTVSFGGLKALIRNLTTHLLCTQCEVNHYQYVEQQYLCSIFLIFS